MTRTALVVGATGIQGQAIAAQLVRDGWPSWASAAIRSRRRA